MATLNDKTRAKTRQAIKNGTLKRLPCEVCGDEKSQAHHTDYTKHLEIKWLCRKHHMILHRKNSPENTKETKARLWNFHHSLIMEKFTAPEVSPSPGEIHYFKPGNQVVEVVVLRSNEEQVVCNFKGMLLTHSFRREEWNEHKFRKFSHRMKFDGEDGWLASYE